MDVDTLEPRSQEPHERLEKILTGTISILGEASAEVKALDRNLLQLCSDLAFDLAPHTSGCTRDLMLIVARFFRSMAGIEELDQKQWGEATLRQVELELADIEAVLRRRRPASGIQVRGDEGG